MTFLRKQAARWAMALVAANSAYLLAVSVLEQTLERPLQSSTYVWQFLLHLALGFASLPLVIALMWGHYRRRRASENARARHAGLRLAGLTLALMVSGVLLATQATEHTAATVYRTSIHGLHIAAALALPLLWFFHRRASVDARETGVPRIFIVVLATVALTVVSLVFTRHETPQLPTEPGPLFPALTRTVDDTVIPAVELQDDATCRECHADTHEHWSHSAHHFSSFNNPAYRFSVEEARHHFMETDGSVRGSRFCAGCHDPVPLVSGAFDQVDFGAEHPSASAGVSCAVCHSIVAVGTPRGNGDYLLERPERYPFALSDNTLLRWVNRRLILAKPSHHKRMFMRPLLKTSEFCGSCHKVHIPEEVNAYRFLRGQDHYDAFRLSGVSGFGASSFYYPPKAKTNCNGCHMSTFASFDRGARPLGDDDTLMVHDHLFPAANTALPFWNKSPPEVTEAHQKKLREAARVDVFGVRMGDGIEAPLVAPLRPDVPQLEAGHTYLFAMVVRTTGMGHVFTQGTADSNEIWLDVDARLGDAQLGQSGALASDGTLDPYAHRISALVLDRRGQRVDRRNVQDIFVPLYDHQIPPGAADVVHYKLTIPPDASGTLSVRVALRYRKFDTTYVQHIFGAGTTNPLPITTLATDQVDFAVAHAPPTSQEPSKIAAWERWNDYGIGMLLKRGAGSVHGALRQAEEAFTVVEGEGQLHGPVNLARVFLRDGRLDDAASALQRASKHPRSGDMPWVISLLTAELYADLGQLEDARAAYDAVLTPSQTSVARGFDFSHDDRVLIGRAHVTFDLARGLRSDAEKAKRHELLNAAKNDLEAALRLDPESPQAHYALAQVYEQLERPDLAGEHRTAYERYRLDPNARDTAVATYRRNNPSGNEAAEAIVLYDLQRVPDHAP